jgi:hypothetical protein
MVMEAFETVVADGERRTSPRANSLKSLRLWLEACRRWSGVDALAVSDSSGCLIAGAGVSQLCEELAALAPPSLVSVSIASKANSQSIADGQAYLCAPIGRLSQRTITRFAEGCARILSL